MKEEKGFSEYVILSDSSLQDDSFPHLFSIGIELLLEEDLDVSQEVLVDVVVAVLKVGGLLGELLTYVLGLSFLLGLNYNILLEARSNIVKNLS